MITGILNEFEKVTKSYENLIEISEQKFKLLKEKKFQEIESANKKEMLIFYDLKKFLNGLKMSIEKACDSRQIREKRLQSLIPFMDYIEKEKVMAYQRCAFTYEQKLKNNLKRNECLVEAMMAVPTILVDNYVYMMNLERKNLFNKKF